MEKGEEFSWLLPEASAASELNLVEGELLHSASSVYSVTDLNGEGCFGKVVRCKNVESLEAVAIKILKKEKVEDAKYKLSMLEAISVLDPDQTTLVRFHGCFEDMGLTCLAFEMLEINLYDLVEMEDYEPICPSEIRPIAEQLLVAVDALNGLGILHADIKPDNVTLASAMKRPLRVKLVDFGEALPVSQVHLGLVLQTIGYRALEVCLGLPFTEAIDVWGVGCVLAYLYLADNLFPVNCKYQMMRTIISVLGQPADHQLSVGGYTKYYFTEEEVDDSSKWQLMTPEEYDAVNTTPAKERQSHYELPGCLDELVEIHPVLDDAELEDRTALIELLKGLLHLDGDQRLTPRKALEHRFITRSYQLQDTFSGPSKDDTTVFPLEQPSESGSTSHENPQESDSWIHFLNQDPLSEPLQVEMSVFEHEEPAETESSAPQAPLDWDSGLSELSKSFSSISELSESFVSVSELSESFSSISELSESFVSVSELSESFSSISELSESFSSISELSESFSAISELSESFSSISELSESFVSVSELSASSSFKTLSLWSECGAEDVPLPTGTSTGRWKCVRERIGRVWKRIQTTLFCCVKPQTDD